jgi:nitroimidazol reductase NimA-like FMN-containing flavoprotein (pyridoxamine 5'-phosphate oxidase superfamily)
MNKRRITMRRSDREIKERSVIDSILDKAQVCRLGMSVGDSPYIVPMNFGYDGDALYLHSATEGKKIDMLRRNPKVCFEIDTESQVVPSEQPCDWGMKYCSVIGFGSAVFVKDMEHKKRALDIIMAKYSGQQGFEYPEQMLNNVSVIRVDITEITGKKARC